MGYRRLFIMRKDLGMSPGKLAAQVAHCAEAYWTHKIRECVALDMEKNQYSGTISIPKEVFEQYVDAAFVKTVCQARNKNHLLKAKVKAEELGLVEGKDFGLIYDKCLTELESEEPDGTTLTGIWFGPLPDETAHEISRKYHLYI